MVDENKLNEYVIFHGPLYGEQLDEIFNISQIGIGSLARHRSGITHLRSLKNREYAARGIPFIYSEIDDDFEHMSYVFKISPDDSPVNIDIVVEFYNSQVWDRQEIRNSIINTLSWKSQMQKVIDSI